MLKVNDTAPDFTLPRDGGGTVTLSALRGAPVVLFFYPKDDTPGCTKESIGFSADMTAFAAAGAQVFGISKDSVASHDKFVAKHSLSTPLLSDAEGRVACQLVGCRGAELAVFYAVTQGGGHIHELAPRPIERGADDQGFTSL